MSTKAKEGQIAKLRSGVLAAQLEKIAEEDQDIVLGANAARRIRDVEQAEWDLGHMSKTAIREKYGLTWDQLATAIDARKSSKEVPFYLRMVDARTQLRWRDGTGEKNSKPAAIILAGGRKPEVTERKGTVVVNLGGDDGK